MTTPTDLDPVGRDLPGTLRSFLAAHAAGDVEASLQQLRPDAVVTDQGERFAGTSEVRAFLGRAGNEFTYTTTLLNADRVDPGRWVVRVRLDGDFPGGVAVLDYRFRLEGDLVGGLDIVPARA